MRYFDTRQLQRLVQPSTARGRRRQFWWVIRVSPHWPYAYRRAVRLGRSWSLIVNHRGAT